MSLHRLTLSIAPASSSRVEPDPKDIYSVDEPPPLARRRPATNEPSGSFRQVEARSAPRVQHEHLPHARRRRRRRPESNESPGKVLWLAVLLVALIYSAALMFSVLKTRHAGNATDPTALAKAATSPSAATPVEPQYNTEPRSIRGEILAYKKAVVLLKDGTGDIDADRLESAEKRLRSASDLAPEIVALHSELARLYELKQDFVRAEEEWRAVLARNPENLQTRLRLASVFLLGGQYGNALDTAQWALEADPYSVEANQIAASAFIALKQPVEAIPHLKRLVGSSQDDLVAQNNLGVAYLAVNDYRNALKTFHDVLRADPGNSVAFYNIAVAHARQGNARDAVDTLAEAARKLGATFVLTWTQSDDFAPIRSEPAFQRFVEQRGETPSVEPAPAAQPEETPKPEG